MQPGILGTDSGSSGRRCCKSPPAACSSCAPRSSSSLEDQWTELCWSSTWDYLLPRSQETCGNEPRNALGLPAWPGTANYSHFNGWRSSSLVSLPAGGPVQLADRARWRPTGLRHSDPCFFGQLPAVCSRGRGWLLWLADHSVCMPRSVGAARLRVQPHLGRDVQQVKTRAFCLARIWSSELAVQCWCPPALGRSFLLEVWRPRNTVRDP